MDNKQTSLNQLLLNHQTVTVIDNHNNYAHSPRQSRKEINHSDKVLKHQHRHVHAFLLSSMARQLGMPLSLLLGDLNGSHITVSYQHYSDTMMTNTFIHKVSLKELSNSLLVASIRGKPNQ